MQFFSIFFQHSFISGYLRCKLIFSNVINVTENSKMSASVDETVEDVEEDEADRQSRYGWYLTLIG